MPSADDLIRSLRDVLQLSPDNVPIRVHLAEMLLQRGEAAEAEKEFRQALAVSANHEQAKLGLAEAFLKQGKTSAALALLDAWLAIDAPAKAFLWAAQAHLDAGDTGEAGRRYHQAVDRDPSLLDPDWEKKLAEKQAAGSGPHAGSNPGPKGPGGKPGAGEGEKGNRDATGNSNVTGGGDSAGRRTVRVGGGEGGDGAGPGDGLVEKPTLTFADVGGMDKLKEEINLKIIHPLEHPEIYRAYGKRIGGGILLYGPPGCGKTFLARATAGQVKSYFLSVGIHDVLNMYLGQSERNLHDLFQLARANTPCVLFFDEVDALAANRTDMRQSAGRQIINQFLSELDGMGPGNEGILVLAATNAPWHLDSAFRRPGRFDRILFVPPPDAPARAEIWRLVLKGKPVEDLDYDKLSKASEGFSGADIKAAAEAAVEAKLREAIKAGKPTPLAIKDLLAAAKTARPTAKEWFSTARNYALYANQGGLYDEILSYLKL